jgi:hypothetical protein
MSNRGPLPADGDRDRERRARPATPGSGHSGHPEGDRILGLHAAAGNAAVVSLLHRAGGIAVQRLWDDEQDEDSTESEVTDAEPVTEETQGEAGDATDAGAGPAADEAVEDAGSADAGALDAAEAAVTEDLDPPRVVGTLGSLAAGDEGSGPGDFPVPGDGITAQALVIQRDPPDGPGPAPRPGGPGDVLKALMPFVQPALDRLLADVLATIRKLKTGEKIAATIVIAPILIGPLTQPGPRRLALDQLDGTDVTFGVIPNLQLKPSITDGQLRGGTLTYDLAPALRRLGVPF